MTWLQISVEVPGDIVEDVTEAFQDAGALSVTHADAADEPILEPMLGEHPLWSATRVVALFPDDCDTSGIGQRLRKVLRDGQIEPRIEALEDRDWSTTWRDTFHAMRFGARLWVVPGGESPAEADAVVVRMDPGLAFGTGTHATTALCLEWLDAHPPARREVIDYGCGSGILAIAARKLGASHVYAVDIDPQAVHATRENASRNGVEREVSAMFPEALEGRPVSLVIANILANPLIELADALAGRVCLQGRIVLTGIVAGQSGEVMAAYRRWFDFGAPVERDGWVLLEGTKQREE
jgi:ribosomal protein L11 methyltransferase